MTYHSQNALKKAIDLLIDIYNADKDTDTTLTFLEKQNDHIPTKAEIEYGEDEMKQVEKILMNLTPTE